MVAGVGDVLWNNGVVCGQLFDIVNLDADYGSVSTTVEIVDYNPNATTIINLSANAFATIADLNLGIINVDVNRSAQITKLYTYFA